MKKTFLFLSIVLSFAAAAQKTINGKIVDASNQRPLPQANIIAKATRQGVTADSTGHFSISVPPAVKFVLVSYAGYETRTISVDGTENNYLIGLEPLVNEAVSVIGSRNLSRTSLQTPVPIDVIPVARIARETGQTDLNQLLTY